MTQIAVTNSNQKHNSFKDTLKEYIGYIRPFTQRVNRLLDMPTFIALKTVEYSIYKWYEPENGSWQNHKYELIFQITNNCTDRCPKCGIWKKSEDSRIPVDQLLQCIKDVKSNIHKVTITGGEPLLYMDEVIKIADLTASLEIPMTVVTNGFPITEDFLIRMKELRRNIIISIDTLDEQKWSRYRGRNHFQVVMTNLKKANDIMGDLLSIQSVLAQETIDEIPVITNFCSKNHITHHVQEYQDFGGTWHHTVQNMIPDSQIPCSAWLNICILPDGNVVKCFDYKRIPEAKNPLGNLQSANIKEILSDNRCDEITKIMRSCNLSCKKLRCNLK